MIWIFSADEGLWPYSSMHYGSSGVDYAIDVGNRKINLKNKGIIPSVWGGDIIPFQFLIESNLN